MNLKSDHIYLLMKTKSPEYLCNETITEESAFKVDVPFCKLDDGS